MCFSLLGDREKHVTSISNLITLCRVVQRNVKRKTLVNSFHLNEHFEGFHFTDSKISEENLSDSLPKKHCSVQFARSRFFI